MEKVPGSQETLPAPFVGIAVFVIKGKKVLIGRRLSSVGHNTYCVPGGHLEFGESFEQCAVREVKEETGLDVEKIEFLETRNSVLLNEPKPAHVVCSGCTRFGWTGYGILTTQPN
ncbi:Geranyl diphosphate phosphohydrolase [Heracleum sosnowskyi]|uniref:Geranyl diphosphate phosphohydrolase n=1 Tax=Heracleum sosnowskyi TaxID=360622 RepID=A0AAD8MLP9_9APIA|nr:Geranyl diphosphate phosphohydrolase [Heracleum sosnowskyi]